MKKIFSSRQVAQLVDADSSSVNRWIDSGKLIAYRTPGGHRRVQLKALLTFIEGLGMPIPRELRSEPVILMIGAFTPSFKKAVKGTYEKDLTAALMKVGPLNPDIVVLRGIMPATAAAVVQALKKHQKAMKVIMVGSPVSEADISLPVGVKSTEIANAILN